MRKILGLTVLLLFTACSDQESKSTIKFQGLTMGTQYHITLVTPKNQRTNIDEIKKHVDDLLLKVNQQMSTYIPDSEISLFNQYDKSDWFPVSNDFYQVVASAQALSKLSQGAFDITVAPLIDLWGFGAKTQFETPDEKQINLTLQNTGYKYLKIRIAPPALKKLNPNIRIDLSAIAKGFAVDKVSQYLKLQAYDNFLVEIGGEIHLQGKNQMNKAWKIGIESPSLQKTDAKEALYLSNLSLATSGDYRNYFIKNGVRYSHTINPITGKPITHALASVTVLHKSTMMADAYATVLMVLGDVEGKVFADTNEIKVNMIIRRESDYQVWKNFDETKLLN